MHNTKIRLMNVRGVANKYCQGSKLGLKVAMLSYGLATTTHCELAPLPLHHPRQNAGREKGGRGGEKRKRVR